LKIAIVHSFYSSSQPSGENAAVLSQVKALVDAGVTVRLFSAESPSGSLGVTQKIKYGANVALGLGLNPIESIQEFSPDVVHVHNLFPNFSTGWLASLDVPVVTTLHNFRHTCANGVFFREGRNCFDCLDKKSSIPSLINACYKDSVISTMPLTWVLRNGALGSSLVRFSDRFIVLSERAAGLHTKSGIPGHKLELIPNFVDSGTGFRAAGCSSNEWAYVGRLSSEKGILELASAWPHGDQILKIYGEGPLRAKLESLGKENVVVFGALDHALVAEALSRSCGLIFPSVCSESAAPLSYLEALEVGLPVIALAGNGAADDVICASNGVVLDTWDQLPSAIAKTRTGWDFFSANSLSRFSTHYERHIWLGRILKLYKSAIEDKNEV
jgi:glycosyltransferase involved in cell wall biosynthesis